MRDRLLLFCARLAVERGRTVLAVAIALAVVSVAGSVWRLKLNSDQDALVSTDLPHHARYMDFVQDFGDLELLYVVIDQRRDPAGARALALEIADGLRAQPDRFEQVHTRFKAADFGDNLLLLLTDAELAPLERKLQGVGGELRPLSRIDRFSGLLDYLATKLDTVSEDDQAFAEGGLDLMDGLVAELELGVGMRADPPQAGISGFLPAFEFPEDQGFQEAGSYLLVSFMPRKDYAQLDPVEGPLRVAREMLAERLKAHPEVEAGITGRSALTADEMQTTSRDMTIGALLGVLGVAIAFAVFFRSLIRPLLAVGALLLAIGWTFGLTTATIGSLNLLSSVFAIVLVGVGIDFGVHVLARYQHALSEAGDAAQAVRTAVLHAGRGNLTAALSTAAAFYGTLFTDFKGLAELGFVAGSGVLLCLLSMLVVYPATLYLFDHGREAHRTPPKLLEQKTLERLSRAPRAVLVLSLVVAVAGAVALPRVRFNDNLLELQDETEESVMWEVRLLTDSDLSSWTTVSLVDTPAEAERRHTELLALTDHVARVESLASFTREVPADRIERLVRLAEGIGELPCPGGTDAVDAPLLGEATGRLVEALAMLSEKAISQGPEAEPFVERLFDLQDRLEGVKGALVGKEAALGARQQRFFDTLHERLRTLSQVLRPSGWSPANLPAAARTHLVGKSGRLAVHAFPREDVWDPVAMERFLTAVRAVDPDITGATVSVYESSKVMKAAFVQTIATTVAIIVVLLVLEYRGLLALLALIPLVIGALWLLEIMGATGLTFNLANFFAIPVLIGVGVDDGVHMVNRYLEDPTGPLVNTETGASVVLTSVTTIIGFGALATASHRGLASFGLLMAVGAFVLVVAAVLVLPALLRLLPVNSGRSRQRVPHT